MKKLFEKLPGGHFIVIAMIFGLGCYMLSTVAETTYEELLHPIPFGGMCCCIIAIVFGFIFAIIEKKYKK